MRTLVNFCVQCTKPREKDSLVFLREISATCAHVPACAFGLDMHKTWAFCGSMPGLRTLAGSCPRPRGHHQSLAGKKTPTAPGSARYQPSTRQPWHRQWRRSFSHISLLQASAGCALRTSPLCCPSLRFIAARLHVMARGCKARQTIPTPAKRGGSTPWQTLGWPTSLSTNCSCPSSSTYTKAWTRIP